MSNQPDEPQDKWMRKHMQALRNGIAAMTTKALGDDEVEAFAYEIIKALGLEPQDEGVDVLAAIKLLRSRAHLTNEGTACANCHDPVHVFELPRLRNDVASLESQLAAALAANHELGESLMIMSNKYQAMAGERDAAIKEREEWQSKFTDERQHSEWLQTECDAAVATVYERNALMEKVEAEREVLAREVEYAKQLALATVDELQEERLRINCGAEHGGIDCEKCYAGEVAALRQQRNAAGEAVAWLVEWGLVEKSAEVEEKAAKGLAQELTENGWLNVKVTPLAAICETKQSGEGPHQPNFVEDHHHGQGEDNCGVVYDTQENPDGSL